MTVVTATGRLRAFIELLDRTYRASQCEHSPGIEFSLALALSAMDDWLLRRGRQRPLQVAVIGPTQAGKSTVVNLLLGAERAEASPLAAFTDTLQGFARMPTGSDCTWALEVLGEPSAGIESVPASQGLDCIVWDTPDFDSHRSRGYRTATAKVAALADVLVLVVSKEKYSDMSVWNTLSALSPLGRKLVICLNKASPGQQVLVDAVRRRLAESEWAGTEVPVVPIPHVEEDNAFSALCSGDAASRLVQAVLRSDNARDDRTRFAGVQALVRRHWSTWLAAVMAEIDARERWRERVDEEVEAAAAGYEAYSLEDARHHEAFNQAIIRLLELLEIPGIARPLARMRSVLTWPVRTLIKAFHAARAGTGGASESDMLADTLDHVLLRLQDALAQVETGSAHARYWWRAVGRAYPGRAAEVRRDFTGAVQRYRKELDREVEQAARDLYSRLQQSPVTLNALRATRLGADAAAVLVAVKTGTAGVSEALLTPAMLSLTSALTEGAVGTYVHAVRDRLRRRQRTLIRDLLDRHLRLPLSSIDSDVRDQALFHIDRRRLQQIERIKAEVLA